MEKPTQLKVFHSHTVVATIVKTEVRSELQFNAAFFCLGMKLENLNALRHLSLVILPPTRSFAVQNCLLLYKLKTAQKISD